MFGLFGVIAATVCGRIGVVVGRVVAFVMGLFVACNGFVPVGRWAWSRQRRTFSVRSERSLMANYSEH